MTWRQQKKQRSENLSENGLASSRITFLQRSVPGLESFKATQTIAPSHSKYSCMLNECHRHKVSISELMRASTFLTDNNQFTKKSFLIDFKSTTFGWAKRLNWLMGSDRIEIFLTLARFHKMNAMCKRWNHPHDRQTFGSFLDYNIKFPQQQEPRSFFGFAEHHVLDVVSCSMRIEIIIWYDTHVLSTWITTWILTEIYYSMRLVRLKYDVFFTRKCY